jgi:hypothetical protein
MHDPWSDGRPKDPIKGSAPGVLNAKVRRDEPDVCADGMSPEAAKAGQRRSGMSPDAGNTGHGATRPASTEGEQTSREAPGSACREICRNRQFHGEHSIRAGDAGKIRRVR